MDNELIKKIAKCFSDEYQSVWLIDVNTYKMTSFAYNEDESFPQSLEVVGELMSYSDAYKWYVDNCVIENDRKRLIEHAEIEYVLDRIKEDGTYSIEYNRRIDGKINYNQAFYSKIEDHNGKIIYVLLGFRDIEIRKKTEIDDLTGVYTRQCFFMKAEKLLAQYPDRQFDLEISDIVDFKKINEIYGVKMGDDILRWNGGYLVQFNSDDVIVGRYGSDQFVLMGPHEFISALFDAKKNDDLAQFIKDTNFPNFNLKFGLYENIPHDKSIISSCDKAHIALNSIKHHYEKIIAVYDDKLDDKLKKQRRIENSMNQALKEEQFKVYYQPKHDAVTGKMVGAEALIRWMHPEFGFMSPADFIPLFEHNGFIVESDYFVWRKTCESIRKWQNMGITVVPISVNASKLTIEQMDLLDKLQKAVIENKISPKLLHLEITESMMSDDINSLIEKLSAIKSNGYEIELDDFGAGYTSMNILSSLPIDVVKLDMSFMKQFGDEKREKVLIACINLAKELGYKTVSEGVEMKEQKDTLAIWGVDYIQGYYYSKPLPEEEFMEYMKNNI